MISTVDYAVVLTHIGSNTYYQPVPRFFSSSVFQRFFWRFAAFYYRRALKQTGHVGHHFGRSQIIVSSGDSDKQETNGTSSVIIRSGSSSKNTNNSRCNWYRILPTELSCVSVRFRRVCLHSDHTVGTPTDACAPHSRQNLNCLPPTIAARTLLPRSSRRS